MNTDRSFEDKLKGDNDDSTMLSREDRSESIDPGDEVFTAENIKKVNF